MMLALLVMIEVICFVVMKLLIFAQGNVSLSTIVMVGN
jgi:hypothetical protein